MINSILEFMKNCPLLKGATFNINYTDPVPVACSVGQTGEIDTIRRYADGGTLSSINAEISLRCPYTGAEGDNVNSAELCSQVELWLCQCAERGIFPKAPGDAETVAMEVARGFRLTEASTMDAVYRCTLKITMLT